MNLVVVITGGLNGLGRYLAERFLEEGHIVNVIDVACPAKEETLGFDYYCADIADYKAVEQALSGIYAKKGRIDVLINNAAKRYFPLLEDALPQDITDTIKVNLSANYIVTREALKYMKKTGFGRIINISSNSAFQDYKKGSLYCATKAGLNVFTKISAKEINKDTDITINALCPARLRLPQVEKEQNAGKEIVEPEEIFKVILKLIKSSVSGAIIPVITLRIFLINLLRKIKNFLIWLKFCMWRYF